MTRRLMAGLELAALAASMTAGIRLFEVAVVAFARALGRC